MALVDDIVRSRLFEGLPPGLAGSVAASSDRRELAAGEWLLRLGDRNDRIFLILSGAMDIRVPGDDHPYVRVAAGECVAELSAIDRLEVSADVVASEPSVVLAIGHDTLWSIINAHATVARNLLRILASRVRYDDAAFAESTLAQRQFEHLANLDGLTGIGNRRWLDAAFARQLARSGHDGTPVALLMIDLDHFKRLNDEYGHLAGDDVLRLTANRLAAHVRPRDLLARYGGEEFAVLLPDTTVEEAEAIAERLRAAVAAPTGSTLPATTISVGVAVARGESSLDALVAASDAALYRAKRAGRNRVSQ